MQEAIRIGIGGTVGAGKTRLIEQLCRHFGHQISMAVITCAPYSDNDANYLRSQGVLPTERILSLQLGTNLTQRARFEEEILEKAVYFYQQRIDDLELILIESAGDGRDLSFHEDFIDASIFLIDGSVSHRILHKGGSGITRSDLLLINKIDRFGDPQTTIHRHTEDALHWRGSLPFAFCSLTSDGLITAIDSLIREKVALVRSYN